ncbi:MarR family transcriptional regulator [Siculibacillus lacustris]|uniref:MarR family transcriptional regulator n=1 Tax=Siculibacillus lacustris TaxID=1549641 RepID=A0A4Q9VU38_9HYPH|nr:sugar-binding domain-containing protein [Siculibacillus lacustris]TBW39261.1 MarR family transcriptional regulator [Siculibacillus lacustris]
MARHRRDDETILRIAQMRYDQRMPQNEIARILEVSESTVSRALKAAMDLGFVEIQISPTGLRDFALERRLGHAYGVEFAVVVQSRAGGASLADVLGRAVARVLEERVANGSVVGVSDGDTVAAVAAAARRAKSTDVDVVSLIGGVGAPQIASHSSEVCRTLALGLGARAWQLPVPAIVDSAEAAAHLAQTSTVGGVFDLMARCTIALVGVGAISPRATVFRHGVIPQSHIETIAASGAVGTICGRFYGADGTVIPSAFDDRTLSVAPNVLRAVPLRIGVAMHVAKAAALRAALVGGWINAVGLDTETAEELLRLR